jgi:oligopeptide/dipeptide ABC transporter ATP-binding protein
MSPHESRALEIRDLEVVYRDRGRGPVRAVAGASISVERGQIVGLVGESGCGKSSLAKAAVGLVPREAGEVLLDGRPLRPLRRKARSRDDARIQMVFQNPFASLNPRRTIGAQIADGLRLAGVPSGSHQAQTTALLEEVGIAAAAMGRYPHQFSGGQRQRIAIARALAADPSVVVLDEPLSSLDASAQAQAANLLVRLAHDRGLALLLISHDLGIVNHVADVVSVMYLGVVVETAPTQALWQAPQHPYTEALVAAIPHADGAGFLPEALPGEVPDPAQPPSGCRFHPRCPYVFDRCSAEVPPLYDLGAERTSACFLRETDVVADIETRLTPLPRDLKENT